MRGERPACGGLLLRAARAAAGRIGDPPTTRPAASASSARRAMMMSRISPARPAAAPGQPATGRARLWRIGVFGSSAGEVDDDAALHLVIEGSAAPAQLRPSRLLRRYAPRNDAGDQVRSGSRMLTKLATAAPPIFMMPARRASGICMS